MPHSRPASTASTSSLLQDVPGSFPGAPEGPVTEPSVEGEESTYLTLSQAVHARRAEYVRPKEVRIKIGSWNTAACKGVERDVGGWFVGGRGLGSLAGGGEEVEGEGGEEVEDVAAQEARYQRKAGTLPKGDEGGTLPGGNEVGLYVLGLQEVVDITSATGAFYPDTTVGKKWKDAVEAALPKGYVLVAEQQLIGLLLLIWAGPEVAGEVKGVSTTSVGTGLMGYMGNKGAVTARMILGETTRLVFVNSHLGAGADKTALERRNWDADQIVQRTRFEPIQDVMDLTQTKGEQIGEEDVAFWCGDLNYRLEGIPGEDVRRLLMLHTRNEYDLSQASARKIEGEIRDATEAGRQRVAEERESQDSTGSSSSTRLSSDGSSRTETASTAPSTVVDEVAESEDPTSLQTTLNSLLPHDELQQQMKLRKAFHDGWKEGRITFLPTYKYDPGSVGIFDSSEKKRAPSWCDRILYRTRRDKLAYDAKVKEEENAKKKDEEMRANGTDEAGEEESILYDYDPETDGAGVEEYDEYDEHEGVEEGVVITKEGFEDEVHLEHYASHQRVLSSDHKPLTATFSLRYDAVVPELKAKVHAAVARDLDKAENEGRPNVTVVVDQHHDKAAQHEETNRGFEGVWFGDVRWAQTKHRNLTIANTGRVAAKFSFIERPVGAGQAAGIAPSWLNLSLDGEGLRSESPSSKGIVVEPGDAVNVELEIRVFDMSLVRDLNEGMKGLDDILVLRVEGGRDHFIPVRGRWLDTSLGQTIDRLIRIPEGGIRKLQGQRVKDKSYKDRARAESGGSSTSINKLENERSGGGGAAASAASEEGGGEAGAGDEPVRFSAPRELFRLTEAVEDLTSRVVAEWEMTHASPPPPTSPSHPPASDNWTNEQQQQPPPWTRYPAWPFDSAAWTERSTSQWQDALSTAVEALDTDAPIPASLPDDLPRTQRLHVLADLLLLFLESMPDGIITPPLWSQIEAYLSETEKAKAKSKAPAAGGIGVEDQKTAIQEILAQAPSHSISFILITSMLDRVLTETCSSAASSGHARTGSADSAPMSPGKKPGGALRRMTGGLTGSGKAPVESQGERREVGVGAMAKVFARAVVRVDEGDVGRGGKKGAAAVVERRRQEVVGVFLRREEG